MEVSSVKERTDLFNHYFPAPQANLKANEELKLEQVEGLENANDQIPDSQSEQTHRSDNNAESKLGKREV
jgi:hypothetical protein